MMMALTVSEKAELEQHEQVIERGLKTFVETGNALLAIRDKRLYRAEYGTFDEYCRERWGIVRQQANRLIAASQTIQNLEPIGSKLPANENQTRPLTKLEPEQQREAWEHVVQEAQETGGRITGKKVQAAVDRIARSSIDPNKMAEETAARGESPTREEWEQEPETYTGRCWKQCYQDRVMVKGDVWEYGVYGVYVCSGCGYAYPPFSQPDESVAEKAKPHVSRNTGNNEWYTPSEYTDAACQVMGGIDCDPASSEIANRTIRATTYYTIETDGLSNSWHGRVWMNPPYSQPLIVQFCDALAEKYKSGEISEACVLVNNASETAWFDVLAECAICRCDIAKRIRFIDKDGNPGGGPLQGQVVLYFGPNDTKFAEVFEQFGRIWHAW